ncbi:uncharacterized protein BT62DRAFT_985135 [Guyanagaster necrorhizus]|uniref:RRM domain-containing protein n=1 Tax=Guyanagaster necrorhizus TaxID=856835 RepID=A0A9P7VYZ8_9AGAR|nr:uncharacterized protein BT62DRAFT_985135 [Guyanagaster necrorhizus MCA 3950]KAG7449537.1 hypothetical protein BT62DRAFT_985135 [Guyanagaster necrorhizus MCA 3950]
MSSVPLLPPSAAAGSSQAVQAAAFADDPRVYFSKESNKWHFEQDDGTELEYDVAKGSWVPMLDEDLVKQQQAAYSVSGVDEEASRTPAAPVLARENKKRKEPDYTSTTSNAEISIKRGRHDKKDKPTAAPTSKNTAVYVTGLPPDTEFDELVQCFSKCGVLEEDDDGEPKVKMYAREDGTFSGDALVVYFKEDSVLLALSILDEYELRLGDASSVMRLSKADFSHKSTGESSHTETKPRRTVDRKKASQRIGKMQKKLQEWVDEDGFGPAINPEDASHAINKNSRVVVLKHMFTTKDLEDDVSLLLDLKEEVREECSSLGEVTNVVLYDKEEDGVITVKFRDPLSAQACVIKMNGRFFDGRRVEASLYNGKQRFQRNGTNDELVGDNAEAEKKRLDDFAQWLLTEGD